MLQCIAQYILSLWMLPNVVALPRWRPRPIHFRKVSDFYRTTSHPGVFDPPESENHMHMTWKFMDAEKKFSIFYFSQGGGPSKKSISPERNILQHSGKIFHNQGVELYWNRSKIFSSFHQGIFSSRGIEIRIHHVRKPPGGKLSGENRTLTQNVLALVAILSRANTLRSILKENIHWTIH